MVISETTPPTKPTLKQRVLDKTRQFYRWLMTDDTTGNFASFLTQSLTDQQTGTPENPAQEFGTFVETEAWHIERAELLELLWGEGWHLPFGEHMTNVMVRSFGLNKEKSLLDLTGGLGAAACAIVDEFHPYVTALEADAELIAHGKAHIQRHGVGGRVSLAAYDPAHFVADKRYDGIIARELLYRLPDKASFVAQVAASLKDGAHVSWTDFVLIGDTGVAPALSAWLAHEPGASPLLLADVAPLWAVHGLEVRVSEDRTKSYADAIMHGLTHLRDTLQDKPVAAAARSAILAEAERWGHCVNAFGAGLRYYRFYANKRG